VTTRAAPARLPRVGRRFVDRPVAGGNVTVRREHGRAADAALATAVTDAGCVPDVAAATVVVEVGRLGLLDRLLHR
jgi:hypothetical protein